MLTYRTAQFKYIMQTVQKRTRSVGYWCQDLCSSAGGPSWDSELLIEGNRRPKSRNSSLGITLTIKSKSNRTQRMKSMQSLNPKRCPMDSHNRRVYLQISKTTGNKVSFDYHPRKVELSAEMTTFIKEDSRGASPQQALLSSPSASQRSNPQGFQRSPSMIQNRLSTSKQESSRGSLLLIRNEQDDERNEHMRIKSLFHSRRMNSANRVSLTNVLNSISEEAEAHEGFGMNTPKCDNNMGFVKKNGQPFTNPFGRDGPMKIAFPGHQKTNSGANNSAVTTNARTRHSSFGSVAGCRNRVPIPSKPLRI